MDPATIKRARQLCAQLPANGGMNRESEIAKMIVEVCQQIPGFKVIEGESVEALLKRLEEQYKFSEPKGLDHALWGVLGVRDRVCKRSVEVKKQEQLKVPEQQKAEMAACSLRVQVASLLESVKEKDVQLQLQVKTVESLLLKVAMLEREKEVAKKLGKGSLTSLQLQLDDQTKSNKSLFSRLVTLASDKEEQVKVEESLRLRVECLEREKEKQLKAKHSLRLQVELLKFEKEEQLNVEESLRVQVALLEQQKAEMEAKEKDFLRLQLQEQVKAADFLRVQVASSLEREKELQEQMKTIESLRIKVAMLEREKEEAKKLGNQEDYQFQKFI